MESTVEKHGANYLIKWNWCMTRESMPKIFMFGCPSIIQKFRLGIKLLLVCQCIMWNFRVYSGRSLQHFFGIYTSFEEYGIYDCTNLGNNPLTHLPRLSVELHWLYCTCKQWQLLPQINLTARVMAHTDTHTHIVYTCLLNAYMCRVLMEVLCLLCGLPHEGP